MRIAGLYNEETVDVKEELDEIDKKVDEAWGSKLNTIIKNMKGWKLIYFNSN